MHKHTHVFPPPTHSHGLKSLRLIVISVEVGEKVKGRVEGKVSEPMELHHEEIRVGDDPGQVGICQLPPRSLRTACVLSPGEGLPTGGTEAWIGHRESYLGSFAVFEFG